MHPGLDRYVFADGHAVYVLAKGRIVNLDCATRHPAFVMSMSFTNRVLAQLQLSAERLATGQHRPGKAENERVARLHLSSLGAELTRLSDAQRQYSGLPDLGPFKPDHYRC